MSKAIAATPVCSRTNTTTQVANVSTSKSTHVPADPVCRRVSGSQTTIPSPSN